MGGLVQEHNNHVDENQQLGEDLMALLGDGHLVTKSENLSTGGS